MKHQWSLWLLPERKDQIKYKRLIDEFHYDENRHKLTADMPFNWDVDFIQKIPYIHAEYYIPKSMKAFHEHEIQMTVNTITDIGSIDSSEQDQIVVNL